MKDGDRSEPAIKIRQSRRRSNLADEFEPDYAVDLFDMSLKLGVGGRLVYDYEAHEPW